jgi:hypothetical protein
MMAERAHRAKTKASPPAKGRRGKRRKLELGTDVQTSYFFMLNCLLHSRVNIGIESNSRVYDEDVNVYLAHLLNSHIDPRYMLRVSQHISTTDAEVAASLEGESNHRRCYETYKANADFLLMAVSVFDLFDQPRPSRSHHLHTPREVFIGRASLYYSLASSYATKLACGESSIARTLAKLSDGIDDYVRILSYMRGQYLDFIRRYSSGELFHLDRALEEIHRDETIEQMRNEFLDTYNAWMKTGVPELKRKLEEQANLLKEMDPTFEFTPPG